MPRLFIACGKKEDVYPLSGLFYAACRSLGISAEYYEEDAGHDWFFWNAQIQRFLAAVLTPE